MSSHPMVLTCELFYHLSALIYIIFVIYLRKMNDLFPIEMKPAYLLFSFKI